MYGGRGAQRLQNLSQAVGELVQDQPFFGLSAPATLEALQLLSHFRNVLGLLVAEGAQRLGEEDWARVGSESAVDGLRHQCKLGYGEAHDLLTIGRQAPALERSIGALGEGEISLGHLAQIAHAAETIGKTSFDERPFLAAAERESVNAFRYTCRKLRIKLDPAGSVRELQDQDSFRFLNLHSCQDGSVSLRGHFSQTDGQLLKTALEPLARKAGKDDRRHKEQRYADALTEICGQALDSGLLPRVGGVRPHLSVTCTLGTLLRVSDDPGLDLVTGEPVHPKTIERLACDSSLTRILFDSQSVIVDVGRERRTISPAQRRALAARDGTCRWPGCHRPAAYSEGHHLKYWRDGGKSDTEELALVCRRHHFYVHEGGWRLVVDEDGRLLAVPPPPRLAEIPSWAEFGTEEAPPELEPVPAGAIPF